MQAYSGKLNRPLSNKLLSAKRTRKSAPIPVIIQFNGKLTTAGLHALRKKAGLPPVPHKRRLPLINAVSARVSASCLKRICGCSGVKTVYLDRIKKTSLYVATPSIGSTAIQQRQRLTGKGINIAIIDTGVYLHPDLTRPTNRIKAFKDWVNGRKKPYDDNGHGTHMAGDAAGNGTMSRGKYTGAAPEAGIVAVKVLGRDGSGYDSTIIKGIDWCIANRKKLKLRILSMSLGGKADTSCGDDPLCQAVGKAVKAGLVVVIAAGNSGPGRRTIESPGNNRSAITVGAVDDRRTITQADDRVTFYSSRGPAKGGWPKPDLVAPGEAIFSLQAPKSKLSRDYRYLRVGKWYFVLSGTSVSAPLVAGAAAQLLQRNPSFSPKQVKAILKRQAFRLPYGINTVGSGEVNMRFLNGRRSPSAPNKPFTKRT
ncbi:MAG: hypothetical protein K0Q59_3289 [Paenibacillus sp.]|nr:hypothetical protein [Paenibacillus sp.]